jgi:hypothetical protein
MHGMLSKTPCALLYPGKIKKMASGITSPHQQFFMSLAQ